MTLGPALVATKGQAAPEVQQTYTRAYPLCHQVPESPQLPQTLVGSGSSIAGPGTTRPRRRWGRHLLRLAHRHDDPVALLYAQGTLGLTAFYRGTWWQHGPTLEHGITLDDRLKPRPLALASRSFWGCMPDWSGGPLQQLGYPDQARQRGAEALALTQQIASPYNRCNLLLFLALVHLFRREWRRAQQWVEEALSLATDAGFSAARGARHHRPGATLTAQDHAQAGLAHIRQGLTACQTLGTNQLHPWGLAMLAESYARLGQPAAGLTALADDPALMATTGDVFYAAEIARLEGVLRLQAGGQGATLGPDPLPTAAAEQLLPARPGGGAPASRPSGGNCAPP